MKKAIFKGAGVAITTPFKKDNIREIDFDAFGRHIDYLINDRVDAIIVCGTTGEAPTLLDDEHIAAMEYCIKRVAGRVPVICGTGSNDTYHAIWMSQKAQALGADGVLCVTPYYNKSTQTGLYNHFKAIAESINIPVILYNVPTRTGVNLAPDTLARLAEIPNINAVKECNLAQLSEVRCKCGDNLNIYSGEDGQVPLFMAAGALGVISVVADCFPGYVHDMVYSWLEGDPVKCWEMQAKVMPVVNALFSEVNPIPVKAALPLIGIDVGIPRMPLCEMGAENFAKLKKAFEEFQR